METPLKQEISSIDDFLKVKQIEDLGHILDLPSGLRIKIRIPGMEELIITGAMTEELMSVAMRQDKAIEGAAPISPEEKRKQNDLFLKLCDNLVIASAMFPEVTDGVSDPANGLISITDLVLKDRMKIAMFVIESMNAPKKEGDSDRFRRKKSGKVSKK